MNDPQVAIIVLCWNGVSDTLECLRSLRGVDYPDLRVIVVDNGSTDDTFDAVSDQFPEVELIQTGENLGFAGGNNVGILHAIETGADAVLLLNNDTVVDANFLRPLVDTLYQSEAIGATNPTIYYYDEPKVIWAAGGRLDWITGVAYQRHLNEVDLGQLKEPEEIDYGVGTALLIKREAIEATGLLDPNFYLYYEETDWCCRARDAGYSTVLVPSSKIWHKISKSIGEGNPRQAYYFSRNRLLFLSKRGSGGIRMAGVMAGYARMAAAMAVRGEGRRSYATMKGVFDFCCHHYGRAGR